MASAAVLIETKFDEIESAFTELEGNLESERASLTSAITGSIRAMTARRLDSVDGSIDSIGETLSDHTDLLEKLVFLFENNIGSTVLVDPAFETLADRYPTLEDRERALRVIEDGWPPELEDDGMGGTVEVRIYIDEQGNVEDSGPRAPQVNTSSGIEELDNAALRAAAEIRWNPATLGGNPMGVRIIWKITYGR